MEIFVVVLVILVLTTLMVVTFYNALVSLRNKVREAFSQVDVQLKRRSDLIPNVVETVKGYATHEKETLNAVISARSNYDSAKTTHDKIKSSNELTQTLGKLFALSEAYPDLKANQNFIKLQDELSSTEDKISVAREFYNAVVTKFNNKIEQFPSNIVASIFKFEIAEFFAIEESEKEVVKVKF